MGVTGMIFASKRGGKLYKSVVGRIIRQTDIVTLCFNDLVGCIHGSNK
jgi:hypothetical protein